MISTEDRDLLTAVIDLNTCLANNDVAQAESVRDALNAMEQSNLLISAVNDAVSGGNLLNNYENADAYRVIVEGVTCVKAKEYKLKALEAATILANESAEKVEEWLEENALSTLELPCEENQRAYASLLIRMCVAAKRYDVMDKIRVKLSEVT